MKNLYNSPEFITKYFEKEEVIMASLVTEPEWKDHDSAEDTSPNIL